MNTIWTVFLKEALDTLRDKRTVLTAILLPIIVFPALILISISVQKKQFEEELSRTLKVAVVDHGNASEFFEKIADLEDVEVVEGISMEQIEGSLREELIDGAFLFSKDFDEATEGSQKTGYINLYYRSNSLDVAAGRLRDLVRDYKRELQDSRYERLGLERDWLNVVEFNQRDISSSREIIADLVGGFVPYIFVILAFTSCMYPAIDLGAGEKERGTLETLLSTPASRYEIVAGKLLVIALIGFLASALSIASLARTVTFFSDDMSGQMMSAFLEILEWQTILLVGAQLIPIVIAFAGVQLALSIYANNMKEAQSLITPATFVVLVPALIAMMPGIELNALNAFIPIYNIALATKAILGGDIETLHLLIVFGSMFLIAFISVLICVKQFDREGTLFRN